MLFKKIENKAPFNITHYVELALDYLNTIIVINYCDSEYTI